MGMVAVVSPVELLEERVVRGAELLFDMEQRGDVGPQYAEWLQRWKTLLAEYEAAFHG